METGGHSGLVPIPEIGAGLRIGIDDLNDDYDYTRNETYAIYIPVELDGKEIAHVSASYTKEELDKRAKIEKYRKGIK